MIFPTKPGYYWAKLKTPSGGTLYHPTCPEGMHLEPEMDGDASAWCSTNWEIVEVWENGGEDEDEYFAVNVFGIPVTQWPLDFFWGPEVTAERPV